MYTLSIYIYIYYIHIYLYSPWNLKLTEPLKNSMVGGLCVVSLCDGLFSGARWVWGNVLCQTPNQARRKPGPRIKTEKFLDFYLTKWMGWFWDNKMFQHPPRGGVGTLRGCLMAPFTIHLAPLGGSRFVCLFVWGSVWNMFWLPPPEKNEKTAGTQRWFSGEPAVQSRGEYLMIVLGRL